MRDTDDQLTKTKALFAALVDADESTRRRRLGVVADDDPSLAATVGRLLRTHDADRSFERPVIEVGRLIDDDAESDAEEATGSPSWPELGPRHRIVQLIGCGAVGDVYLAEECGPTGRHVAVKVFRPVRIDGSRRRRFEIEARALATLSHPGIAQVHDAGRTADGRPWLAMELVSGPPIDLACRQERLDAHAILALFVDLCDAVQHAHARGIIHRDLKPNNVLVAQTRDGLRVKVIDFGVAKLADEVGAGLATATMHGQIVGTLEYMSPERWRGESADTRGDVFSLGVLLHRLLTGRMPTRQPPHAPSSVSMPEVSGRHRRDLETIVLTAMAETPEARYASPRHLAEDLGRLLRGEPIVARRASVAERTVKLVRRRPWQSVAALLLVAVAIAMVLNLAITRQRLREEVDLQRTMIVMMLDEVLHRLYSTVGAVANREMLATSLLEATDRLLVGRPDDPELLEARARLLMELGNIKSERGEDSLALRAESVAIHDRLAAMGPRSLESTRRHADAIVRLGYAHNFRWRDPEAMASRDECFARALAMHEEMVAAHPDEPGPLDDLCWSLDRIAEYAGQDGRWDEFRDLIGRRLELAGRLLELDPDRVLSKYNEMDAHRQMARWYEVHESTDGDRAARARHLETALSRAREIIEIDPFRFHYRRDLRRVLVVAADAAMRDGQFDIAAGHFEEIEALSALLMRTNADMRGVRVDTMRLRFEHAHAALSWASPERVRELYRLALETLETMPHSHSPRSRQLHRELALHHGDPPPR